MEIFLGCLQHTSVQDGGVDGSTGDVHWKSKHWYQITVDTHVFFVCGAFCICGRYSVKDVALLGDGYEGLHKQRIQTRTRQLYLPV